MQFLTSLFGGSENTYVVALLALGIVVVLIVLGAWALKFIGGLSGGAAKGAPRKRLTVVDRLALDNRRQILIIRRDNVEHVLLTGGPSDVIVEAGIPVEPARPQARRPAPRAPAPTAEAAQPNAEIDEAAPEAPQRVALSQEEALEKLRDFRRTPADARKSTSIRHTGLLRPVSLMDRGILPPSQKPQAGDPDSAKEGRVEIVGNRRLGDGNGRTRLGEGRKGVLRETDPRG